MDSFFETSTTVEPQGEVRIVGVPFEAGTEVAVTISPKVQNVKAPSAVSDREALSTARDRMLELFRTTKGFRNSPRIPREELYERGSLR